MKVGSFQVALILLAAVFGGVATMLAGSDGSGSLKIGRRKQLFADGYIIEELENVYRVMNQPVKYGGNPLIELNPHQRPGSDDLIVVSGSVLYDQEVGLFKMWYEGANYNWNHNVVCYSYSKDGIHWELPDLGLIQHQGSKENNVVFEKGAGEMAPAVMKDTATKDTSRRYKMLYKRAGKGWPLQGINTAYSADGIHWKPWVSEDVIEKSDSPNSVLWDARLKKYIAHTREWEGGKKTRVVLQSASDNFINWTREKVILRPDKKDPLGRQFYNMEWMPYADGYFGFLAVYDVAKGASWDKVNIQLTYSRDGWRWSRLGERQPFIENGREPGMVDWGQVYVMQKPIVVGDEIWIYYVGFKGLHWAIAKKELQGSSVNLCKIRLDGFVSLDSGGKGVVVTKPLVMTGERLVVNANAAHDASVKVEVLDENWQVIEGFSKEDGGLLSGDHVRHVVSWKGKTDVSLLKNKSIRLRFYLDRSKLYSFVFAANK